jgi:drug/metabolite transporter (DMT)-like permease
MQTTSNLLDRKGIWFAIISGLLYGLLGYFGVTLMHTGMSVYNMSFWRFFFALVLVFAVVVVRKHKPPRARNVTMSAIVNGGLFYTGSGIFFFLAANYIGTGQAMVMFFIYPIWVMILNWYFLGQPFRPHYILALVLIVAGLIFLVDIKEIHFDFLGVGLSVLASLSYAVYIFWSKRLALDPLDSTMFVSTGCALAGFLLAVIDGSFYLPSTNYQWLHLLGLSVVCTAVPILLMLEAIKYLSSDKASLLSVFEPVFTVIFGVLLLNEVLTANTILGMVLILLGAMIVVIRWPDYLLGRLKRLG